MKNKNTLAGVIVVLLVFCGGLAFFLNGKKDVNTFSVSQVTKGFGGFVDEVKSPEIESTGTLELRGWTIDTEKNIPAKAVVVVENDQIIAKCEPSLDRPDVVEYLKNNQDMLKSGWNITIPASTLGQGKHNLWLYAINHKNRFIRLSINESVPVQGECITVEVK